MYIYKTHTHINTYIHNTHTYIHTHTHAHRGGTGNVKPETEDVAKGRDTHTCIHIGIHELHAC